MSKVRGVVQVVSHKWEKVSVCIDDTWYSTKEEFYKEQNGPELEKGMVIEFESGASGKFLQNVKVLEGEAAAGVSAAVPAKRSGGFSNAGVAVGAAMNQAISLRGVLKGSIDDKDLVDIRYNVIRLYGLAEELKANVEAGDINVGKEERADASDAIADLAAEFDA